ncbi:MAG: PAS domain S-box protein [Bacteroidetes bacterium]|nr:PAS domain S-box protein [Bacteroidota bacterium]
MRLKLKIQQKLQLFIIPAAIVIYIIAVGYISFNARKKAYKDAIEITNKQVQKSATDIKTKIDAEFSAVIALSNALKIYKDFDKDEWQKIIHRMYLKVFENDQNIYALWDSWELSAIDPNWDKPYGRISHSLWKENGVLKDLMEYRSMDGDSKLYAETKSILVPNINEPYEDLATEGKANTFLLTSLNSPLVENGKYIGVIAFDITLIQLQEIVDKIKPYEGSYAFLISNGGIISGHPNKEFLNKKIAEIFPEEEEKFNISEKILNGDNFSYNNTDENDVENYFSYVPIQIMNTKTPWSIAISVPVKTIMKEANNKFRISIIIGLLGILLLALIVSLISKNIINPLTKITELLKFLSKGHIDKKMRIRIETGDEIEEMTDALNDSINGLNKKVEFANHIKQGELNYEFNLLSEKDVLGKSLIAMRNSLQHAKQEDENRKIEDEKQNWTTQGLAKFGEILRQNNDNIETLSFNIIKNLVNYLDSSQGSIFIKNDSDKDDIYYELTAAIAFDRKKMINKRIELGEGLVGRCVHEKLTIYMIDIPEDYVHITSGLGESNPRCLLLVPLMLNNEVLGVVEIVSFNEIDKYKINFIEKVGESIASTISSVKINERTAVLLEQSQQQGEELAAQEEEMRQNLEELKATQEDAARREGELSGLWEALSMNSSIVIFDMTGKIIDVNDKNLEIIGSTREQMLGKNLASLVSEAKDDPVAYKKFWEDLKTGKSRTRIFKETVKGKEIWTSETYTPIIDKSGKPIKVLNVGTDITKSKTVEIETSKKLKNAFIKIEKLVETEKELRKKIN